MIYGEDHLKMMETVRRFIADEIDPFVDEWEAAEIFPAHELFKKLGALGLLGVTKPEQFGGLGLDFTYSLAVAEALGGHEADGDEQGEDDELLHDPDLRP